eukprot:969459_1
MSQSMFTGNQGFQAMIYSDDAANFWFNNDFECVSNSNLSLINISSTSFTDNTNSDYLLYVEGKPTYIDGASIFRDNECTMSCITSIDASLEINGDVITNAPNFMQFMHLNHNATNNITLCIHNNNINSVDVSQYISFLNLNANNAMIKFDNCPAYAPNHSVVFDKTQAIVTENLVYDEPGEKVGKQLNCIQKNADLCQIFCNATVACFGSTFIIDETVSTLHLHCESSYSCQNSMIVSSGIPLPQEASLHIICDADSSCEATEIILTNIDHFRLDCITPESCIDARINLSSTITSEVNCYELNACDDMEIHTDNDNTTLTLHEYSSNVLISNPVGYNQNNLNCGSEDAHFTVPMRATRSESIANTLYSQIPCSDVTFICNDTNIDSPSKYCDIEAMIMEDPSANSYDFYQCYGPITFQDVIQLQCLGTCPQSPTTDPTAAPSLSPTIPSHSPSNAPSQRPSPSPTESPTSAPTISPTLPPTPQCPTIFITVVRSPVAFNNEGAFNGLYTYHGVSTNGFSIWDTPQSTDKNVTYDTDTSNWIINGIATNEQLLLSTSSIHPPIEDKTSVWSHSTIPGIFRIQMHCIASYSPTDAPSDSPSSHPSSSPTSPPTSAPTAPPTHAPSISPSSTPTSPPTLAPSFAPIHAPSGSPTGAPSNSPSFSPTNAPTYNPISSDDFPFFMQITFILIGVDKNIKTHLGQNPRNESDHILNIMKDQYVANGLGIFRQDFMLQALSIQGVEIEDITPRTAVDWMNKNKLDFLINTECTEFACASIKQQSKEENDLDDLVTGALQEYYANDQLQFKIKSGDSLQRVSKDAEHDEINWELIGMSGVCGLLILIAFLALLFNKKHVPMLPGFHIVDNAKWTSVVMFSLQFWDFYSDIILALEIWNIEIDLDERHHMLLLISAIGSTFFVLVPYIANLAVAARIKHMIYKNPIARDYFQGNTALFSIAVVITGGCYPALALISSGLFGLQILTSGLTQYELKRMSRIKVFGTVVLENIPQIICQVLYAYSLGKLTHNAQLAMITSLLSVTASTLSFLIDRDTEYTTAVQYYLSLECTDRDNATPTVGSDDDDDDELMKLQTMPYNQDDGEDEEGEGYEEKGDGIPYTATGHHKLRTQTMDLDDLYLAPLEDNDQNTNTSPMPADQLRPKEKKNIIKNRGLTAVLGKHLAECFRIPPKNIEIGCSNITKKGLIIHVVHYVSTEDVDTVTQELRKEKIDEVVTPQYFTQQLYLSLQKDAENVLRKHFKLNKDFHVQYHRMYPSHARTLSTGFPTPGGAVQPTDSVDNARHDILKRVATRIELAPLEDTMDTAHDNGHHRDEAKFQHDIAAFFVNCGHDEAQFKQELAAFYARDKSYDRRDNDNSRETGSDYSGTFIEHDEDIEEQKESDCIQDLIANDLSVVIRDERETMRRQSVTNDEAALGIHLEMQTVPDQE